MQAHLGQTHAFGVWDASRAFCIVMERFVASFRVIVITKLTIRSRSHYANPSMSSSSSMLQDDQSELGYCICGVTREIKPFELLCDFHSINIKQEGDQISFNINISECGE